MDLSASTDPFSSRESSGQTGIGNEGKQVVLGVIIHAERSEEETLERIGLCRYQARSRLAVERRACMFGKLPECIEKRHQRYQRQRPQQEVAPPDAGQGEGQENESLGKQDGKIFTKPVGERLLHGLGGRRVALERIGEGG